MHFWAKSTLKSNPYHTHKYQSLQNWNFSKACGYLLPYERKIKTYLSKVLNFNTWSLQRSKESVAIIIQLDY